MDSFFKNVSGVVYHTDEYTERWSMDRRPYFQKQPRSLFGSMNGFLLPAIQVIKDQSKLSSSYVSAGTIYPGEITEARPELIKAKSPEVDSSSASLIVKFSSENQNWECTPNSQICFSKQTDGRFQLLSGERFEILMYCDLNRDAP